MAATRKPSICIVSPGTSRANNGNWHTAARWERLLRDRYAVTILEQWTKYDPVPDLLIALHARRSAQSLATYCAETVDGPALLVLTGTDVYRDIHDDFSAEQSLLLADALVVLQPAALHELPQQVRPRAHVIYQSADALAPEAAGSTITMIGHLRHEKDPATFMHAAALVESEIGMQHIGGVLDAELGVLAEATQRSNPRYRWLGALPQAEAREHLRRSHVMVISSKMEGGANVIIEAVTSGVPVLASDISGNRGMLGDDYAGYFPVGDAAALARLIDRSIEDRAFYDTLRAQCAARAPLFAPEAERAALLELVDNLLHPR